MTLTRRTQTDLERITEVAWLLWKAGHTGRNHQRAQKLLDQAAVKLRELLETIDQRRKTNGQ